MTINTSELTTVFRYMGKEREPSGEWEMFRFNRNGELMRGGLFNRGAHKIAILFNTPCESELSITIRRFEMDRDFTIPLRFELKFSDDKIDEFFPKFAGYIRRGNTLDEAVEDWLKAALDEKAHELADEDGDTEEPDIEHMVVQNIKLFERALNDAMKTKGVLFRAKIMLEAPESLRLRNELDTFSNRTNDSDAVVTIKLDVTLDFIGRGQKTAPRSNAQWNEVFQKIIQDFMEKDVTREDYFFSDDFEPRLQEAISSGIEVYGWRCARLSAETESYLHAPEFTDNLTIQWESIQNRVVDIVIKAELKRLEGGLLAYEKAGKPPLRKWLKDMLTRLTAEELLESDIRALAKSPDSEKTGPIDEFRANITKLLDEEARRIGLNVRMLVAEPQIDEWKYLEDRPFDLPKETYETANPSEKAEFDITVIGHYSDADAAFKASQKASGASGLKITTLVTALAGDCEEYFGSSGEQLVSTIQRVVIQSSRSEAVDSRKIQKDLKSAIKESFTGSIEIGSSISATIERLASAIASKTPNDQLSVEEQITSVIRESARATMRNVPMEEYLGYFFEPKVDDGQALGEHGPGPAGNILARIRKRITDDLLRVGFKATEIAVRPRETELYKTLEAIKASEPFIVEARVLPANVFGKEFEIPFSMTAKLNVPDMKKYSILKERGFDRQNTELLLGRFVHDALEGREKAELFAQDYEARKKLSLSVQNWVQKSIDEYGLSISIQGLMRGTTEEQQQLLDATVRETQKEQEELIKRNDIIRQAQTDHLRKKVKSNYALSDAASEKEIQLIQEDKHLTPAEMQNRTKQADDEVSSILDRGKSDLTHKSHTAMMANYFGSHTEPDPDPDPTAKEPGGSKQRKDTEAAANPAEEQGDMDSGADQQVSGDETVLEGEIISSDTKYS